VPRFAWCRREKWDGLDLDGLDDARARQPKTGNWAHPRHFRRQVSRAGGRAVTSHESDFANERCDADAEDFQGGRIAQARGGRSSGAQAAGVTSSGGGAVPVKIVDFLDSASVRCFFTPGGGPLANFFQMLRAAQGIRRGAGGAMMTDVRWGGSSRPMLLLAYAPRTAAGELI
jgi:hypothetical protein